MKNECQQVKNECQQVKSESQQVKNQLLSSEKQIKIITENQIQRLTSEIISEREKTNGLKQSLKRKTAECENVTRVKCGGLGT